LTACASAGLFPNNNLLLYQGAINIVVLNELSAFPSDFEFINDWLRTGQPGENKITGGRDFSQVLFISFLSHD